MVVVVVVDVEAFCKVQIGSTFLVPAHPGSPGQRCRTVLCTVDVLSVPMSLNNCLFLSFPLSVSVCVHV